MCLRGDTPPERVEATVSGDSVVAVCPDEHQAAGYGFAMTARRRPAPGRRSRS
jgi:hypothetical protein